MSSQAFSSTLAWWAPPVGRMSSTRVLLTGRMVMLYRSVGSIRRLSETLDSVLLGQNLANANTLIGRRIEGLNGDGDAVSGVVDKVTIQDKAVKLHVGDEVVPLTNVREVLP